MFLWKAESKTLCCDVNKTCCSDLDGFDSTKLTTRSEDRNEKSTKRCQSNYLLYIDANNLYGWAMSQELPTGDFKWEADLAIIGEIPQTKEVVLLNVIWSIL